MRVYVLRRKRKRKAWMLSMSIKDKSIDFYEQKAFYKNLKSVRKVSKQTNTIEERKIIGLSMLYDIESNYKATWKAMYSVRTMKQKPMISVVINTENTMNKYEIDLTKVHCKRATCLEIFALCSYAQDNHLCGITTFGSFDLMMKFFQRNAKQHMSERNSGKEKYLQQEQDWEDIINMMKREYLDDGLYAQYQNCLQLLDMIDYFMEKNGFLSVSADSMEEVVSEDASEYKRDSTAEAVMDMIKAESYKYCID